jgi:hypothetical protein
VAREEDAEDAEAEAKAAREAYQPKQGKHAAFADADSEVASEAD